MAFPDGFIAELKARNDLSELVSGYSSLRRAGSNTVCCCPFHSEKTPSFTIFSPGDHFYCFGCGAGGDVITFLMRVENLDYRSAVEQLCERCGMQLPESDRPSPFPKVDKKRLYELNAAAARYFHQQLMDPQKGLPAREYLVKRGFDLKNVNRFGLGYASGERDGLSVHLTRLGYTPEEMKSLFLAGLGRNGRLFDYFTHRLMFPVIDVSGKVVAFSGRYIGPPDGYGSDRKYFNTSDTPVFKKSRNLYGLNVAKNAKSSSLILCEGNMDVLALQAAGFENSVAGLGTALTADQVRLIQRYADTVYLCYDSDAAGQNAARKAMRLLSEAGVGVKVLSLKGAKDPDEFLQRFGKLRFEQLLKNAEGQIEYRFRRLTEGFDLETMDGKKGLIREVIEVLAQGAGALETDLFLQRLSQITGVSKEVLVRELALRRKTAVQKQTEQRIQRDIQKQAGFQNPVNPDKLKFSASASKEENVLGILLLRSEYLSDESIRERIREEVFLCEFNRKLVALLLRLSEGNRTVELSDLGEYLSADEMSAVVGYTVRRSQLNDNSPAVLKEMLDLLKDAKETKQRNEALQPLNEWLEQLKAKKKGNDDE